MEDTLPKLFAALGDLTRYKIVQLLVSIPGVCVSDLAHELDLSVSAVSQQCKLLEMSGVIRRERYGQQICYKLRYDNIALVSILKIMEEK